MRERPILFSGPMVRAILEGRKTQTRRVMKPQPYVDKAAQGYNRVTWWPRNAENDGGMITPIAMWRDDMPIKETGASDIGKHSPFPPGDRLWVREAWAPCRDFESGLRSAIHRAGPWRNGKEPSAKWKPSIHMPRWASRITLEVVAVRVERLQDISDDDIRAEGVTPDVATDHVRGPYYTAWAALWRSINGPDSWAANPWVWVVEFKRINPN